MKGLVFEINNSIKERKSTGHAIIKRDVIDSIMDLVDRGYDTVEGWLRPRTGVIPLHFESIISRHCAEAHGLNTTYHIANTQRPSKLDIFKLEHVSSESYQALSSLLVGNYYKYKVSFSNPENIIVTNVAIHLDEDGQMIYDQISNKGGTSLHYRGEIYRKEGSFNILAEDVNNLQRSELLYMSFRLPTQSFGSLSGIITGVDNNGAPSSSKILLKKVDTVKGEDFKDVRDDITKENETYEILMEELVNNDPILKVTESIKDANYWSGKLKE